MIFAMVLLPYGVFAEESAPVVTFEDELNTAPNGAQTLFRYTVTNNNEYTREYYIEVSGLPESYDYDIVTDSYDVLAGSFVSGYIAVTIPVDAVPESELNISIEAGWVDRIGDDAYTQHIELTVIIKEDYSVDIWATQEEVSIDTVVPEDYESTYGNYYSTIRYENILYVQNTGNVKMMVEVDSELTSEYNDNILFLELGEEGIANDAIDSIMEQVGIDGWDVIDLPTKILPSAGNVGDTRAVPFALVIERPTKTYDISVTFTATGYSYRNDIKDDDETTDSQTIIFHIIPGDVSQLVEFDWQMYYDGDSDEVITLSGGEPTILDFYIVNLGNVEINVRLTWFLWRSDSDRVDTDIADLISSSFDPTIYDPSSESEQYYMIKEDWVASGLWVEDGGVPTSITEVNIVEGDQVAFHLTLLPPTSAPADKTYKLQVVGASSPVLEVRSVSMLFDSDETIVEPPGDDGEQTEESTTIWWLVVGFVVASFLVVGSMWYYNSKFTSKGLTKGIFKGGR